uniref:Uncharacterized protein n=1 Tax=Spermophilus dauricus TaxID=99837 RepID=A0A8C9PJY5_SPEDA
MLRVFVTDAQRLGSCAQPASGPSCPLALRDSARRSQHLQAHHLCLSGPGFTNGVSLSCVSELWVHISLSRPSPSSDFRLRPGQPGHMTTLQCRSEMWFDLFLLSQEGSANVTQRLRSQYKRGFFQANFTLNASEQARGATYRCYGSLSSFPSLWSDPSESLAHLLIGLFEKPSLTAEPGPQVASGGQVALLCHTTYSYDIFILCRDRAASLPQTCSHQNHSSFLMSPVTLAHGGTYRCYFSSRDRPGLWSLPSDPLELLVTAVVTLCDFCTLSTYMFIVTIWGRCK